MSLFIFSFKLAAAGVSAAAVAVAKTNKNTGFLFFAGTAVDSGELKANVLLLADDTGRFASRCRYFIVYHLSPRALSAVKQQPHHLSSLLASVV